MLIPERLRLIGDQAYRVLANTHNREVESAAWNIIRSVDDVLLPYGKLCLRLAVEELKEQAKEQEVSYWSGASLWSAPLSSQLHYTT